MKSLLLILLPTLMLITHSANAADQYKLETKVIKLPIEFPLELKSGLYSDKIIKSLYKIVSTIPDTKILNYPSIVIKLNTLASLESDKSKFTNIKITKDKNIYTLHGKFEVINSKTTIWFQDTFVLNDTIIKVHNNVAFIASLKIVE